MKIMKHKIAIIPTIIVFLILIALIVISTCILVSCSSKSINAEAETSQVDSYELYVLDSFSDGESRLILYNNYKVKSEDFDAYSGNINIIYNTTDGTQIIFADNGITVINPKGYKESFTQGYIRRK